jgi:hypothetical protein
MNKISSLTLHTQSTGLENSGLIDNPLRPSDNNAYRSPWMVYLGQERTTRTDPLVSYELGPLMRNSPRALREFAYTRFGQLLKASGTNQLDPLLGSYDLLLARKLTIHLPIDARPETTTFQQDIIPEEELPEVLDVLAKIKAGEATLQPTDKLLHGLPEMQKISEAIGSFLFPRVPIAVAHYPEGKFPYVLREDIENRLLNIEGQPPIDGYLARR